MDDLKLIKKHYGEKMMHFCRETFPTILEQEGKLFEILSNNFAYNKFLYDDIDTANMLDDFKEMIYSKFDHEKEEVIDENIKTPKQLLDEAGYILYECHSESDIQKFKKYYIAKEELCTFNGDRLNSCHVFFAVKKNVNEIKRENFNKPERQDEYGTSVISIQFSRGNNNTLSIKNRYNHTVPNPDATFSNNLDNIIPGLTQSFNQYYQLHINSRDDDFELPGYVLCSDKKLYKYNFESDNIYYCPNNIIIEDFTPRQLDPSRYLLLEYYLIDMKEKRIDVEGHEIGDDFIENIQYCDSITVVKKENKTKEITIDGEVVITANDKNEIIKYKNHRIKGIGHHFLYKNTELEEIDIPNVRNIGDSFLRQNEKLKRINLPKCKEIGYDFLLANEILEKINLPIVTTITESFLLNNERLEEICFPELEYIGDSFILYNRKIKKVKLPKVKHIGYNFLNENLHLEKISLPNVELIYPNFLKFNEDLKHIYAPKLKTIGNDFLFSNTGLREIDLPSAKCIHDGFLQHNQDITKVNLPKVESIGDDFLFHNKYLKEINLPKCKEIGDWFLRYNWNSLEKIEAPKLEYIGNYFLRDNNSLKELSLPNVRKIGIDILMNNNVLKKVDVPKLKHIRDRKFFIKYLYLSMKNKVIKVTKKQKVKIKTR